MRFSDLFGEIKACKEGCRMLAIEIDDIEGRRKCETWRFWRIYIIGFG